MNRLISRPVAVLVITGAVVLSTAAPAAAHVTVSGVDAVAGGSAAVTFRVPNESDTARTSTLRVQLPPEHPLTDVLVRPLPGWSVDLTRAGSPVQAADGNAGGHAHGAGPAVSEITWTATDAAIGPGQYQEFEIRIGPLPAVESLSFKAIQTYDDGRVDRWIDAAGGEHPAPVLSLSGPTPAAGAPAAGSSGTQLVALWLAAVSMLIAVGSVALTVWLARTRRGT